MTAAITVTAGYLGAWDRRQYGAIFGGQRALLLTPLPYPNSGQLAVG